MLTITYISYICIQHLHSAWFLEGRTSIHVSVMVVFVSLGVLIAIPHPIPYDLLISHLNFQ